MKIAKKNLQDNMLMLAEDPGGFNWVWLYANNHNINPSRIFVPDKLREYVLKRFDFEPNTYADKEYLIEWIIDKRVENLICSTCSEPDADWKYLSRRLKFLNITSIIDAADNYKERFIDPFGGNIIVPANMYVPTTSIKKSYSKFFDPYNIFVFHNSFMEVYRSLYLCKHTMREISRDILFVDEGIDKLKPNSSYLDNPSGFNGLIFRGMWALSVLTHCCAQITEDIKIDVLIHPNGNKDLYANTHEFNGSFYENINPWYLAYKYKLVVGMTSNLLGETALLGIPTISILTSKSDIEICHHLENGKIDICLDENTLIQNLERYIFAV